MRVRKTPISNYKLKLQVITANKLIEKMEREGYGKLSVIQLAVSQANKITGSNSMNRFEMGENMTQRDRDDLKRIMDRFKSSDWTTKKGRDSILDKRITTWIGKEDFDKKDVLLLFDFFQSEELSKAVEQKLLDSEQIVDLFKKSISKNDIKGSYNMLLNSLNKSLKMYGNGALSKKRFRDSIERELKSSQIKRKK